MAVEIDSLQIEIEATSSDAASKIDQLAASLTNLKSAAKGGAGLTAVTNQLNKLKSALSGINENSKALNELSSMMKNVGGGASGASSAISSAARTARTAKVDYSSLSEEVKSAAKAFSSLPSSVQASVNAISRAKDSINGLNANKTVASLEDAGKSLSSFRKAISETSVESIGNAYASLPKQIRQAISANAALENSNQKTAKSFGVLGTGISSAQAKFGVYLIAFRQIASVMSDWVTESNDYVENLNLFTVAMGEYAEEAKAYAEEVQSVMGIDSSEWMRNQGVFMQMASGFGVASDSAALMSKNLTQLGYDISSFYNISIEDAMQKLQSGIAGEIEPLRRLGYAIDQATLEQVALNHGITESVNSMSQAEKSQLRYIAIMEQSGNVMGDLSRTIQTPANAMRILNQQITQLSRALGNLLIPFLQAVIPWVQAFVEVITEAINALARLVGFELPTIDYSGMENIASGAEDVEEAIGGASGAAAEFKKQLLGIDELTILEPPSSGGGGGGVSAGGVGGDLGLDLPEYDFLNGLEERTSQIKNFLKEIADEVFAIGAGFAAWKIAKNVATWFDDLKRGKFDKISKLAAGIGLMVTGFTLEWQGAYDIGYSGPTVQNVLKTIIGSALGIGGSLLTFGTGPLGWTIGILAALSIAIGRISVGYDQRRLEEELAERFGEIELTVEQAKELAERVMSTPLSIQLDSFVVVQNTAQEAIESYLESFESVSDLVWRVSVGLEVDKADLENSVDTMIANAQSFLNAQREFYTLTVRVSFTDEVQTDMALFVDEYFNQSEGELERLGTELKQTMLDAIADGILDEQERQTIADLQAEVNQMMSAIANAEYRAKLVNTVYELDGDLSFESVKAVADNIMNIAQEQLNTLEDTHLSALALVELKYQSDGNYDEYIKALENEMQTYFANRAEVSAQAFEPLMDKINSAFSEKISQSKDIFSEPIENLLGDSFADFLTDDTGILIDGSITDFVSSIRNTWHLKLNNLDLDKGTRMAIEEAVKGLEPSAQQLNDIAEQFRALGLKVPEGISNGLSDYNALNALTGNAYAVNYLIGQKFSTDPSFINTLAKVEDGAELLVGSIADGFLDHTEIKQNVDGTISFINDEIGELVVQNTPQLQSLFETLGIDITDSLEESAISGAEDAMGSLGNTLTTEIGDMQTSVYNESNKVGEQISKGIAAGITKRANIIKSSGKTAVNSALLAMKQQAQIQSPSRLFRDEVGLYIGSGVAEGITDSSAIINGASERLINQSVSGMKSITDSIVRNMKETQNVLSGNYTTASEYYITFVPTNIQNNMSTSGAYNERDYYDPNGANDNILNAIMAAAERIVTAVNENGNGDIYMDGDKVGEHVTAYQNRQNRMYGKTLQKV